jgi:hypothetical protein
MTRNSSGLIGVKRFYLLPKIRTYKLTYEYFVLFLNISRQVPETYLEIGHSRYSIKFAFHCTLLSAFDIILSLYKDVNLSEFHR